MDKIKITDRNCLCFYFKIDRKISGYKREDRCEVCGFLLNPKYVKIMKKLQKANLLKNDRLLCCCCFGILKYQKETKCKCGKALYIKVPDTLEGVYIGCSRCHTEKRYNFKDIAPTKEISSDV